MKRPEFFDTIDSYKDLTDGAKLLLDRVMEWSGDYGACYFTFNALSDACAKMDEAEKEDVFLQASIEAKHRLPSNYTRALYELIVFGFLMPGSRTNDNDSDLSVPWCAEIWARNYCAQSEEQREDLKQLRIEELEAL